MYVARSYSTSAVPIRRRSPDRYHVQCHVCSRTTQIPETSRFQEEIRFCGIFPLDRGIAGVDAISRDIPGFTGMVGRYGVCARARLHAH